jgi:hypothetical protein
VCRQQAARRLASPAPHRTHRVVALPAQILEVLVLQEVVGLRHPAAEALEAVCPDLGVLVPEPLHKDALVDLLEVLLERHLAVVQARLVLAQLPRPRTADAPGRLLGQPLDIVQPRPDRRVDLDKRIQDPQPNQRCRVPHRAHLRLRHHRQPLHQEETRQVVGLASALGSPR